MFYDGGDGCLMVAVMVGDVWYGSGSNRCWVVLGVLWLYVYGGCGSDCDSCCVVGLVW